MQRRTNTLGVSEPEIQQSGADQTTVALPGVSNVDRAIRQVGTTAQLQFYDWEANVFGNPDAPIPSLFEAAQRATKLKPRVEAVDVPPGGPSPAVTRQFAGDQAKIRGFYDRQNDTAGAKFYLFG